VTAAAASLAQGLKSRRLLGYAGLLPFAGCLAVVLLADDRGLQVLAASQLLYYAALIASFLFICDGISVSARPRHGAAFRG